MARYALADTHYEIGLQELGESIVCTTFRDAAQVLLGFTNNLFEAQSLQSAVVFIQGSGLERVITQFGLSLDPDQLRGSFKWKIQHVRSSSAITLDGHSWRGASPVSHSPKE